MADLNGKGVRTQNASDSAPSWDDYLDALRIEGKRYRPASLRAVLEERDRKGGNPIERNGDGSPRGRSVRTTAGRLRPTAVGGNGGAEG